MSTKLSNKTVLIFTGPTASSKTEILGQLFASQGSPAGLPEAEVVSADSMQIYRGMDIGTSKATPEITHTLKHHLIDIRDPWEQFNVGDFVSLADLACEEIIARGRLPIVSGGTGYYLRSFVSGLPETTAPDPLLRQEIAEMARAGDNEALKRELERIDPEAAGRIHINDAYRLKRALEIARTAPGPMSALAPKSARRDRWNCVIVGIDVPRDELRTRIELRAAKLFDQGLPGEIKQLADAGATAQWPGMRAIGYREFFSDTGNGRLADAISVKDGRASLEPDKQRQLLGAIVTATRQYAKRQMTLLKTLPDITWVSRDPGRVLDCLKNVTRLI